MRRYLRDPTFSRFDTIPECDGHTHRHTDRHTTTAYTALSKASRGKNEIVLIRCRFRWWVGWVKGTMYYSRESRSPQGKGQIWRKWVSQSNVSRENLTSVFRGPSRGESDSTDFVT